MTIQELLELPKTLVITEEDKIRIANSFQALEEEFEKQAEAMRPTAEMLNRLYTL